MALKMSDIAKMANVSKSAVSLAMNGKAGISQKTRQRILEIISKQGYRPLRQHHPNQKAGIGEVTLLVVTSNGVVQSNYQNLPFFHHLIATLSDKISHAKGRLQMVTVPAQKLSPSLAALSSKLKNGVLVLGTDLNREQVLLIKQRLQRVVFLDTYFEDVSADFVTMDNYQGARLAGRYMIHQGYRKIGYFASASLIANFDERRRGFGDALRASGITLPSDYCYLISPTQLDPQGLDLSILSQPLPQAIFCEDDYMAIRLIKAAQRAGLNLPTDLAIMGFDDITDGTLLSPELTTIHVPVSEMVQQALNQRDGQLTVKNWHPLKTLVATTLVKRESL